MADNGSGTYTLPSTPFTSNTTISSSAVNANLSDIATALNARLTRNGESAAAANLPMGDFRHTGVGNATARTHYAAAGQVQDSGLVWGGTSTGSANAHAISVSPGIPAYAAGQVFRFIAGFTNTTAAATLAVSGLAATAILLADGVSPLPVGSLFATQIATVLYDGTAFRLLDASESWEVVNHTLFAAPTGVVVFTLPTRFNRFRLEIDDCGPGSSSQMFFRTSIDGGATYLTGATDYTSNVMEVAGGVVSATFLNGNFGLLSGTTAGNAMVNFEFERGAGKRWLADAQYVSPTGPYQARYSSSGQMAAGGATAFTNVEIGFVGTTVTAGRLRLLGSR